MSIYPSPPVDEYPEVVLSMWTIREVDDGRRYFVGFSEIDCDGRVSTPIKSFDPEARIGYTESGRRYVLVGAAGTQRDAEYVWNIVVRARNFDAWRDVTADIVPDYRRPLRRKELRTEDFQLTRDFESIESEPKPAVPRQGEQDDSLQPRALLWRARVYALTVSEDGSQKLTALSELSGRCTSEAILSLPVTEHELYLYAVRATIQAWDVRRTSGSIDDIPLCLKVWISGHQSVEDIVGKPIARLDVLCAMYMATATISSLDWCSLRIRPFSLHPGEGVWELVQRALAVFERPKK